MLIQNAIDGQQRNDSHNGIESALKKFYIDRGLRFARVKGPL